MANRNFNRAQNLEKEVKSLFADVAIGASGAPTLTKGLGITSFVQNATGDYTITLDDKYVRLMNFNCTQIQGAAIQGLVFQVLAETVSSTKTVRFSCVDLDGTPSAVNPTSGSRLLINIDLKNSTADHS